jgi:hypothetical protein
MEAALKAEIQEIVELVKTVPDSLQLRAFEILLQDALDRFGEKKGPRKARNEESDEHELTAANEKKTEQASEGLNLNALPMRVKAFMKRTKVTAEQLEQLFHIEGKQYEPIWVLKAMQFSKAQVQIALMQSLRRALASGEFSFDRGEVRAACKERGTLNENNFKANFQNNVKYFSGLEKDGLVSLTDDGMTALAALITELTAGEEDGE